MSIFTMGTAATDYLFLEDIKKGIEIELYQNTTMYGRFKTRPDLMVGKYGVMKLLTATPKSFRASSTSTYPTADQGVYNEFLVYMKRGAYGSLQFDGLAIACGKGKGAIKEIVRAEIDALMFYAPHKLNKQFWGDGSGRLAQVDAANSTASTTVTIDSPIFGLDSNDYTVAHQYLEKGMVVDIYYSTTLESEENEISTITDDADGTSTLVMGTAVTCTNDAWIFDHDTYAATEAAGTGVPMGLHGIISTSDPYIGTTASSAFQNITRTGNTFVQAQAFTQGASATALTSKKILEVIHKIERYGKTSVIVCNDIIWRNCYAIWEADKTMPNPSDHAYWGGTSGLKFFGGKNKGPIPIIRDEDCPDQSLYFIDDSKIVVIAPQKGGMEWIKGDNGHVLTKVQGKDESVANLRWYYNMSVSVPQALGVLTKVKHAEV